MHFKRMALAILLVLSICCTACQQSKQDKSMTSSSDSQYMSASTKLPQGYIYLDGDQMMYLDYETLKSSAYCNKANCTHKDAACVSKRLYSLDGTHLGPIHYKDYIYYFVTATRQHEDTDGDGREDTTYYSDKLMKYDSKNDVVEIATEFEGSQASLNTGAYLYKNYLYFSGQHPYIEYAELPGIETPENKPMEEILYKVNLDTGEVTQFDSIYTDDLQYQSAWMRRGFSILGEIDGKLWMNYYYCKDESAELLGVLGYTNIWFTLDLETDEIELVREDAPYLECITDGYICYIQDNMATLEKGEEIWQFEVGEKLGFGSFLSVADDKVWHFSKSDSWYYDLQTSQKVDLGIFEGEEFMEISVSVIDVYEDNLICYYENYGEFVFEKIPLDSVVKE